ncbi:MAG: hypothetical protein ABIG55_01120 [Candidatus Omnitrophota bacterium]
MKLIEDPDGGTLSRAKTRYKTKRLFSAGFFKSLGTLFKMPGSGFIGGGHELSIDFQVLNWVLKVCIAAAAAYLIVDVVSSMNSSRAVPSILTRQDPIGQAPVDILEVQSSLKPYSYYGNKVGERDIFRPYEPKVEEVVTEGEVVPGVSVSTSGFASELEVVGIAWSDEPDVILRNRKLNRTYFLKKNSTFGDAKVVEIFEDGIVIEYNGEQIELR